MSEHGRILNPSSIGNLNEDPIIELPTGLIALLNPCMEELPHPTLQRCGGVNGFHHTDCPTWEGRT